MDISGPSFDVLTDVHLDLSQVIKGHKLICSHQLGKTTVSTCLALVIASPLSVPFHCVYGIHNETVKPKMVTTHVLPDQTNKPHTVCTL